MTTENRLCNAIIDVCNLVPLTKAQVLYSLWKTGAYAYIHLTESLSGMIVESDKDFFVNSMSEIFDEVMDEQNLKLKEPN